MSESAFGVNHGYEFSKSSDRAAKKDLGFLHGKKKKVGDKGKFEFEGKVKRDSRTNSDKDDGYNFNRRVKNPHGSLG